MQSDPLSSRSTTQTPNADSSLIRGTGEMADRIRSHNWAGTELGPISLWPAELLTFVNLILASREIMTLFWGRDRLMIYNDSYVSQLDNRHPALGRPLREVWPEVVDQVEPLIRPVVENGRSSYLDDSPLTVLESDHLTERFYTASFEPIWVRHLDSISVGGVFQTAINNTAKIQTQRALQASEAQAREAQQVAHQAHQELQSIHEKLQLAMESAGQGSFFYDETTGLLSGDTAVQHLFEQSSLSGSPEYWIAKVHEDDQQRVREDCSAAVAGVKAYNIEHRVVRSDGVRWIQARAKLLSKPGETAVLMGISEDITHRKTSEEALRSTAERLNLAQSTGHIAIWDWDVESGKLLWNGSELCWGRSAEEMDTAEKCFTYIYPEDVSTVSEALEPALRGKAEYRCEFRVLWPDGSLHWLIARGQSVSFRASGTSTRLVGVNSDITERKLAEAAVMQNEKLAAVGRLASSIAHEINNPLESVTNLIFLAKSAPEITAQTLEYLDVADRELRRASNIVSQTLRFHKQATAPTRCFGKELFAEILTIYKGRLVNVDIRVEERYREKLGVECLEGDIRQVLSNLISNAIDAMPTGGRLILRSREATDPRTAVKGVTLMVADTGFGMPAVVQQKIFEAFYSTKGIGGAGLGLWISKEIVNRHHGALRMRSSQRSGCSGNCVPFIFACTCLALPEIALKSA